MPLAAATLWIHELADWFKTCSVLGHYTLVLVLFFHTGRLGFNSLSGYGDSKERICAGRYTIIWAEMFKSLGSSNFGPNTTEGPNTIEGPLVLVLTLPWLILGHNYQ